LTSDSSTRRNYDQTPSKTLYSTQALASKSLSQWRGLLQSNRQATRYFPCSTDDMVWQISAWWDYWRNWKVGKSNWI